MDHFLAVRCSFVDDHSAFRFVRIAALIAGEWCLVRVFRGHVAFEQMVLFGHVRALVAHELDVGVELHVSLQASPVHHPGK